MRWGRIDIGVIVSAGINNNRGVIIIVGRICRVSGIVRVCVCVRTRVRICVRIIQITIVSTITTIINHICIVTYNNHRIRIQFTISISL